jgi:hypothetical protein
MLDPGALGSEILEVAGATSCYADEATFNGLL